jgi:hypothetical protein
MTRVLQSGRRIVCAIGLVAVAAWPAAAQDAGEQRASVVVGGSAVHVATRLNTPFRFYGPLPTAETVRAMAGRPGMSLDLEAVFQEAGIAYLTPQAMQVLSSASPADLRVVSVPVGRRFEWMAQRRGGRPGLLRQVEWRGDASFQAYEFLLDDGVRGYTFILPQACGNLSLAATGPSPRAAAAEARRAEEARVAEDARRADEARRAAEAKAAEEARRADDARRAAEAKAAEEARLADEARRAEDARRAEAERQTADAAERDRRAKVDVFFAALGGKERRVRERTPAAGAVPAVFGGQCAGLVGGKAGPDIRLGRTNWRFVPALGVAVNTRETDDSSVFGEVELNYVIGDKGFIGTGIGAWDVTHGDTRTGSWLLHVGRELGRSANDVRVLLVAEGRLFFDELDAIENNYQAWAGLRLVFR